MTSSPTEPTTSFVFEATEQAGGAFKRAAFVARRRIPNPNHPRDYDTTLPKHLR